MLSLLFPPLCARSVAFFTALAVLSGQPTVLTAAQAGDAPPLKIVVVEGEGALNNIRTRTAKAPVVRVEDDDSQPVPKAVVTFVLPDIGAGGVFSEHGSTLSVLTDEKGEAVGRGLRPNNVAGQFQIRVTASSQGRNATSTVTQTNVAPAADRGGPNRKIIIAGLVAGAVAGVALAARGGGSNGGNPNPAAGGGTSLTPGSPVFGPPR